MPLSAIHFLNWFYSFSLNKLSLIYFCNWKKKNLFEKYRSKFKNYPIDSLIRLTRPCRPFYHVYLFGNTRRSSTVLESGIEFGIPTPKTSLTVSFLLLSALPKQIRFHQGIAVVGTLLFKLFPFNSNTFKNY